MYKLSYEKILTPNTNTYTNGIGNKGIGKNFKSAVCLCLGVLRVGFYYWVD